MTGRVMPRRVRRGAHDRLLRRELREARGGRLGAVRRALGWMLVVVGGALFAASNVASRAGVVVLPFDHHHLFGQFGGGFLLIAGLAVVVRSTAPNLACVARSLVKDSLCCQSRSSSLKRLTGPSTPVMSLPSTRSATLT